MADNSVANPGALGDTFATAETSFGGDTCKFQGGFLGLLTGAEGSRVIDLIVGGAGAVGAGVQRMTLASNDPAVVALQIMDDWDETNRCAVNLIAGQVGVEGGSGVVTALTQRVVLATDVALPAIVPGTGATNLGKAEDAGHSSGDVGVMMLAVRNDTFASLAGTDLDYAPLQVGPTGALRVTLMGTATGGLLFNHQIAPATPAKTAVKASAGQIYTIIATNDQATPVYIKLFNVASGSVTLGTTAADLSLEVPANTAGAGFVLTIPQGVAFGTAITMAITGAIALTDNTSITANKVLVSVFYT